MARTGYRVAVTDASWVEVFNSSSDGLPFKGVELMAETQDVEVRIYGLHETPTGMSSERLTIGQLKGRWAVGGVRGDITKIEAKSVAAGGLLNWNPIA